MIWVVAPAFEEESELVPLVEAGCLYHVSMSQHAAAAYANRKMQETNSPFRVYKLVETHFFGPPQEDG